MLSLSYGFVPQSLSDTLYYRCDNETIIVWIHEAWRGVKGCPEQAHKAGGARILIHFLKNVIYFKRIHHVRHPDSIQNFRRLRYFSTQKLFISIFVHLHSHTFFNYVKKKRIAVDHLIKIISKSCVYNLNKFESYATQCD